MVVLLSHGHQIKNRVDNYDRGGLEPFRLITVLDILDQSQTKYGAGHDDSMHQHRMQ